MTSPMKDGQRSRSRTISRGISAGQAPGDGRVATITLNRPEKKNPLTFEMLCRAARSLPRPRHRRRRAGDRADRRRRQFLLGRRCLRDHRAADQDGDAGASRLHADDRRSRQGDAPLPATDHRRGRRHLRRRRRHPRDGLRSAPGDPGRQDRLPVHPRRPRRRRYGRLRPAAADDRPGPRRRASLHRPGDDGRGGPGLGLLQPPRASADALLGEAESWPARSPTAPGSPMA